jgi:hypothetical protein
VSKGALTYPDVDRHKGGGQARGGGVGYEVQLGTAAGVQAGEAAEGLRACGAEFVVGKKSGAQSEAQSPIWTDGRMRLGHPICEGGFIQQTCQVRFAK